MKILIISDYDCCCNMSAVVLEDSKLNSVNLKLSYDLFNALEVYVRDDNPDEKKYYEAEYPAHTAKAKELIKEYDKIIMCRDGDILSNDYDSYRNS